MAYFEYSNSPYPIRQGIKKEFSEFWQRLAKPGTWWTGAERVAIARESRTAVNCSFCSLRKQALSPYNGTGEHESDSGLDPTAVDAVHRIVTDQNRITRSWVESLPDSGISTEGYVELTGIVVCVFSIDEFHRALGLPLEDMPEPVSGEPSHYRPCLLYTSPSPRDRG